MKLPSAGILTAGLGAIAAAIGFFVVTNNSKVNATNSGGGNQQVFSNVSGNVVSSTTINDDYDTQRRREGEAVIAQMQLSCKKLAAEVRTPVASSDFNSLFGLLGAGLQDEVKLSTYIGQEAVVEISTLVKKIEPMLGEFGMERTSAAMSDSMAESMAKGFARSLPPEYMPPEAEAKMKEAMPAALGEARKQVAAAREDGLNKARLISKDLLPEIEGLCSYYDALKVI